MNCTSGDRAVVVRVNAHALADAIGMHIKVVDPIIMYNGAFGWTMDRPRCVTLWRPAVNGGGTSYREGSKLWFDKVPDAWLQPIRGRIDAARTETGAKDD